MKKVVATAVSALLFAGLVHAQAGLTGKWEGKTKSGGQVALDLTTDKAKLTGTLTESGQALAIEDGKVSKDTFSFSVSLGDRTESFAGKITGNELTVWIERRGPDSAAVLTRIKTKKP